ncbi:hypothetical protein IV203_004621 [Nitzschia inconspicua]|uniref:Uncharacterized protein n=1 Tax=Nitzschia inconspicua TaxID=303405 RepID=A0A9K3L449_9STRA|nr:hypothetical protein IV203_004621 [Nitzschia inconspicua]
MSSFFTNILSRVSTTPSTTEEKDATLSSQPKASSSWSSFLSPKAFLSQVVAQALSEFFIIEDPIQQIQSVLCGSNSSSNNNNRIVLQNLQFQPKTILSNENHALRYTGSVRTVEFSWTWGGNDQTSWIREIVLLVQGVSVHVSQSRIDETEASNSTNSDDLGSKTSSDTKDAQSYLERYVQQIMDHLTLKLEDVQVTVDVVATPNNDDKNKDETTAPQQQEQEQQQPIGPRQQILVQLQSLFLLSKGKQQNPIDDGEQVLVNEAEDTNSSMVLSQRLSVHRFAVDILVLENPSKQPRRLRLLEPFGYAAQVTRNQGRRFQDGFLKGLEVQGEVFYDTNNNDSVQEHDARWTMRLGRTQVKTVCDCLAMLTEFQPSIITEETVEAETRSQYQPWFKDLAKHSMDNNDVPGNVTNSSTRMILPLPALAFVFEDEMDHAGDDPRIDLPDCIFSCRLDGSLCQVQGEGTISINDTCPLLQLPNGAGWVLDGVAKTLVVQKQHEDEEDRDPALVAHINLEAEKLQLLIGSLKQVAKIMQEAVPPLDAEELWEGIEKTVTEEWKAWQKQNESSLFSIAIKGSVSMHVVSKDDWFDATLGASSVVVRADGTLWQLQTGPMGLGPTSLGNASLMIPAGNFDSSMNEFCFHGDVSAQLESMAMGEKLVDSFSTFAGHFTSDEGANTSASLVEIPTVALPFPVKVPLLNFSIFDASMDVSLKNINAFQSTVNVGSVSFHDGSGMCMLGSGLSILHGSDTIGGKLQILESLCVPEVATIQRTEGISFIYDHTSLRLEMNTLSVELPEKRQKDTKAMPSNPLNFPISLSLDSSRVTIGSTGFDVTTGRIDLSAIPDGVLVRLEQCGKLNLALTCQATGNQFEAAVGIPEVKDLRMDVDMTTMRMVYLRCSCPQVGSTSFGKVVASAPTLYFEPTLNTISVKEEANIFIESIDKASKILDFCQPLIEYFSDPNCNDPTYKIMVTKGIVLTEMPSSFKITVEGACFDGDNAIQIKRIHMAEKSSGASASFTGISCRLAPMAVMIRSIDTLVAPAFFCLKEPIQQFQCWYTESLESSDLSIVMPSVFIVMAPPQEAPVASNSNTTTLALPCNINCSIKDLSMVTSGKVEAQTKIQQLFLSLKNQPKHPSNPLEEMRNTMMLCLSFHRLQNAMLQLNEGKLITETMDTTGKEFHRLHFQAVDGMVSAGFSSVDWDSVFLGNMPISETHPEIRLPFVCIEQLELRLKYQGKVVGTDTKIMIPKFVGNEMTTSNDIVKHFKKCILRRVPAFLAKGNVLGANLGDSAASTAGMIALGASSSIASAGAGVAGILAYDGVVGAIKSGKQARGVSEHEKYQFGDITRGSIRAMGSVRQGGAGVMTSSAKEYANENSSRLGSAAGSTVGLIAGAALLGPVGLVAGAVVGARAGANAFRNRQKTQTSTASDTSVGATTNDAQIDLLNDSFVASPSGGATANDAQIDLLDDSFVAFPSGGATANDARIDLLDDSFVASSSGGGFVPPSLIAANSGQLCTAASLQQQQSYHIQEQQNRALATSMANELQLPTAQRQTGQFPAHATQPALPSLQAQQQQSGYKFGDFSRGVIARGREKDGRDRNDGYKFGDFTRGLFR